MMKVDGTTIMIQESFHFTVTVGFRTEYELLFLPSVLFDRQFQVHASNPCSLDYLCQCLMSIIHK